VSLERTLLLRHSVREYRDEPLGLPDVAQLLWAAQGIASPEEGRRTVPSAGALYPLEILLVAGNVTDLSAGLYRYQPEDHTLLRSATGDVRPMLAKAALDQECVREAAAVIAIAAVHARTSWKYGERAVRYVAMEAGHAAQNVYLQAASLGIGTVAVAAFYDDRVKKVLRLEQEEDPLYLLPVGKPAGA
jgi:SagB-type dehydrogenase family enzyme